MTKRNGNEWREGTVGSETVTSDQLSVNDKKKFFSFSIQV